MREFKVKYNVIHEDKYGFGRVDSSYSERFECETFEEAIEYGRKKAKSLDLHFEGIDELAR